MDSTLPMWAWLVFWSILLANSVYGLAAKTWTNHALSLALAIIGLVIYFMGYHR